MSFHAVAGLLAADLDDIQTDEWDNCEEARARSALSRAYYAAFRALKVRLQDIRRIGWQFPAQGAHSIIRNGIERAMPASPLVEYIKNLHDKRTPADYQIGGTFTITDAQDLIDVAGDAIDLIHQLTNDQLQDIAMGMAAAQQTQRGRYGR